MSQLKNSILQSPAPVSLGPRESGDQKGHSQQLDNHGPDYRTLEYRLLSRF